MSKSSQRSANVLATHSLRTSVEFLRLAASRGFDCDRIFGPRFGGQFERSVAVNLGIRQAVSQDQLESRLPAKNEHNHIGRRHSPALLFGECEAFLECSSAVRAPSGLAIPRHYAHARRCKGFCVHVENVVYEVLATPARPGNLRGCLLVYVLIPNECTKSNAGNDHPSSQHLLDPPFGGRSLI